MEEHYAQAAAAEQDAADGEAIDAIRMRAAHEQRAADVEAADGLRPWAGSCLASAQTVGV